jgi:hypothetical protein
LLETLDSLLQHHAACGRAVKRLPLLTGQRRNGQKEREGYDYERFRAKPASPTGRSDYEVVRHKPSCSVRFAILRHGL